MTVAVASAVPLAPVLNDPLTGRQVFPETNWWNLDVSRAPVDSRSAQLIAWISGRTTAGSTAVRRLHPDFGPPPYGIPYVVVPGSQPRVPLTFVEYGSESDAGSPGLSGYPIPVEAQSQAHYIEGDVAGGGTSGDRHLLIVDRDRWLLYESYATRWNSSLSRWEAGSGAVFDLASNARRPDGWTSADAAGLAIFPGLLRYDEVAGTGEITHAFRVTTRGSNGYVWPASHSAGSNASAPPMGTRLRLMASRDIFDLRTGRAEDLPRDEALRVDRGRQRFRHVHRRHDGRALEQRRPQPGICGAHGGRLRGDSVGWGQGTPLAAPAHPRITR